MKTLIVVLLNLVVGNYAIANNKVCKFEPTLLNVSNNQTNNWKRNIDHYISVQQLYALIQKQSSLFLVDIRVRGDYDSYHINTSYNFPRESVLARPQLKDNRIVLINDGVNYRKSELLLTKMAKAGFKEVHILDGGIPYWKIKMDRDRGKTLPNNNLRFDTLFNEDLTGWSIFNFSDEIFDISEHAKNIFIKNTSEDTNPTQLKQAIRSSASLVDNVVLIADKDSHIQLYKNWQSKLDANIFVMSTEDFRSGLNKKDLEKRIYRYKQRTDGARFACE